MSNGSIPGSGGAMSKIDRQVVMRRAWDIFRTTYHYPQIKFASIGRHCFNGCLRRAWAEAREARRIGAIPRTDRAARIAVLTAEIERAQYCDSYSVTRQIETACRAEIAALSQGSSAKVCGYVAFPNQRNSHASAI
ncbi:hypothetical protein BH10PSE11_BH10PSE11_08250 [soil metagenome]